MTNDGLALLGRLVRERRERLGLNQGDLAQYGGPRVSTVGKIERAEQGNYPLRTRHQLENALGWSRGVFDEILTAPAEPWWDNDGLRSSFIESIVEDHVPDLSRPTVIAAQARRAADLTDDELLAELTYRMKAYAKEMHDVEAAATSHAPGSGVRDAIVELDEVTTPEDPQGEPGPAPATPPQEKRRHG